MFSRIVGRLQVAEAATEEPGARLDQEELGSLFDALDEATGITDVYLDRQAVSRALIRVETQPTELHALLAEALPGPMAEKADDAFRQRRSLWIDADRAKLTEALRCLASLPADPRVEGRIEIEIREEGDEVRCFVGADPAALDRRQLLEHLERHLDLREIQVDAAFARAIVERHGGSVLVDEKEPDTLGYSVHLPLRTPPQEGEP